MEVTQRALSEIEPYANNAKEHSDRQVGQIAASIKEFGFNQPIVVDKAGIIIVGHGRYTAAHLLGLETVPVIVVDLPEEKAKAYRLADNKLNESEWNMDLVIQELRELSAPMVDLTGFDSSLLLSKGGAGGEGGAGGSDDAGKTECPKCHHKFFPPDPKAEEDFA